MEVQNSIPHMAQFSEASKDHILLKVADGEQVWHMRAVKNVRKIQKQLFEFARASNAHGLFHGDIRPWNVFLNKRGQVTVIDWNLSAFAPDHGGRGKIDLTDVRKLIKLLKGEIRFQDAWAWEPSWYPDWCRRKITPIVLA
jgi:RIO-like serine/threonine protein kinase